MLVLLQGSAARLFEELGSGGGGNTGLTSK